jgi:hypothetical protein
MQYAFRLVFLDERLLFFVLRGSHRAPPAPKSAKEATMSLSLRLNVLMAVLSFGFIAAIVLGMV